MFLIWGFLTFLSVFSNATFYGDKPMTDVLLSESPQVREASRSVAVQMRTDAITEAGPFASRMLLQSMVCENEPFVEQPVLGTCTGFLIAPDRLMTAGHCIANSACSTMKWVFDFKITSSNQKQFRAESQNVYSCKRLIKASYSGFLDYAIIELDRSVKDRQPLILNPERAIQKGLKVSSISSPRGLPLKYSFGEVLSDKEENFFHCNVDLMRGSSGAPIFAEDTMEVVGIVARGDQDYQFNGYCNEFHRCGEFECRGEEATRLSRIEALFN